MTTSAKEPYTALNGHGTRNLAWLLMHSHEHEEEFGDRDAPGSVTFEWAAGGGWWLSVVMPGHYAYEKEDQPDPNALLADAVNYYRTTKPGEWKQHECSMRPRSEPDAKARGEQSLTEPSPTIW